MVDRIATHVTYAASGSAVIFGVTANELAAIVGVGVAILSLLVNIWFKFQHLKLARERIHEEDNEKPQRK